MVDIDHEHSVQGLLVMSDAAQFFVECLRVAESGQGISTCLAQELAQVSGIADRTAEQRGENLKLLDLVMVV
ncbi:MAG: hypothetical protein P8N50_12340, partial [Actinomycetota bacterium]|nr:hypothetical protein [Actinomycetota bacterium]